MNIDHGIPDTPSAFWSVVAISAFVGVASFPVGKYFYGRHWRTSSASQLRKLSHLRLFLLHHLDDLEAILDAVRSMKVRTWQ